MKLSFLFVFFAAVVGIAACTAAPDGDEENFGTAAQGLCRVGTCDTPGSLSSGGSTSSSGFTWGGVSSGGTIDPGSSTTFECKGKQSLCLDPDNYYLSCNADRSDCVCMNGCGGGGWPFGTYNPCPFWAPTYSCNYLGSCRCY